MKRMKMLSFAIALLVVACSLSFAQAVTEATFMVQPTSKLWFDGTSTIHNFIIDAKSIEGSGKIAGDKDHPTVAAISVKIPVKDLESGKSSMNGNMQEALKMDENAFISYEMTTAELVTVRNDTAQLKTTGVLMVAGTKKSIEMTVSVVREKNGSFRITGTKSLLMTDFGVKPPTMMLGTIRTGNEIIVHFDILAGKSKTTETSELR